VQVLNAGISDAQHAIRYIHYDFAAESKIGTESDTSIDRLLKLTSQIVDHVGIFHAGTNRWANSSASGVPVQSSMQQRGILRSNCIDCLDRTNAAQLFAGERALTLQFQALGITNSDVPSSSAIIDDTLVGMYYNLGNQLANQYVGSSAHDKTGSGQAATSSGMRTVNKIFVAAQRYISNTFTDQEKQQAIDVFLGNFRPLQSGCTVWQTEDRNFVWSSAKNYEYCAPYRNRPPDGWWREPLRCFDSTVQVGAFRCRHLCL
jgi:phosphatidylinositol 3,5-bisphosphate 5-phosphatase